MAERATNELSSHFPYLTENTHVANNRGYSPGDVIRFNYKLKERYVLVLNVEFEEKMHGLSLDKINHRDLKDLPNKIFLTRDPQKFYEQIRTLVKLTDSYRTFFADEISSVMLMRYSDLIFVNADETLS